MSSGVGPVTVFSSPRRRTNRRVTASTGPSFGTALVVLSVLAAALGVGFGILYSLISR